MSDLMTHALCSCQLGQCSGYLCECRPRRSLIAAVRDISAVRDLPIFVWDDLLAPKRDNLTREQMADGLRNTYAATIVSLASERAIRSRRKGCTG